MPVKVYIYKVDRVYIYKVDREFIFIKLIELIEFWFWFWFNEYMFLRDVKNVTSDHT